MAIGKQVEADLKASLKARDQAKTSCLRLIRAALNNQAKELRRELSPEEEIQVLSGLAKQRRDSIEQFEKGGRQDLADKEKAELALIETFLPAQLDEAGIKAVLDEVFDQVQPQGPKDMGQVMKAAMARLQGQADGKLVNQLVRQRLP
ncbi:hypothetical protein AAU61_08450 [Desulfocarbo indianensis]|nr:hypothetical protein AAU61_08450 [Desulfocarbo indianensis]